MLNNVFNVTYHLNISTPFQIYIQFYCISKFLDFILWK